MTDSCGRTLDYLRVSLTDRCNLRCSYCMPRCGVPALRHGDILTLEETLRLCRVFSALGVSRVKVTGGEPLVRKGADNFIARLAKTQGIRQVTLTTNGLLLPRHLPALVQAGVRSVNISLDTLRPQVYETLTGANGLEGTLCAIQAATQAGLRVKINVVPLNDVNRGEYAALAALAKTDVAAVRFIEVMPIGLAAAHKGVPLKEVASEIEAEFGPLTQSEAALGNGPAEYYSVGGFNGKVGFIAAVSHAFCAGCNRLRLTADGALQLCLAHKAGADLKTPLRQGASDEELAQIILRAVENKPARHHFKAGKKVQGRGMFAIGG